MVLRAILEGLTVILVLLVVNGVVNFSVCSGFSELGLWSYFLICAKNVNIYQEYWKIVTKASEC